MISSASPSVSPLRAFGRRLRDVRNGLRHRGVKIAPGVFIDPSARIESGAELGTRCAIFSNARICGNTRLGADSSVGHESVIGNSSLGDRNIVETRCAIHGSQLGNHTALQTDVELTSVRAGRWTYFARGARCNDVEFGMFCSIGPDCLLGVGEHPSDLLTTSPALYSTRGQCGASLARQDGDFVERRPIRVGSDVWLGARAFLRDGISIGHGAIVAAGAVVTRDVAAYSIVGGVPARPLRSRFSPEIVARLLEISWWDWPEKRLVAAQPVLAGRDANAFLQWLDQHDE